MHRQQTSIDKKTQELLCLPSSCLAKKLDTKLLDPFLRQSAQLFSYSRANLAAPCGAYLMEHHHLIPLWNEAGSILVNFSQVPQDLAVSSDLVLKSGSIVVNICYSLFVFFKLLVFFTLLLFNVFIVCCPESHINMMNEWIAIAHCHENTFGVLLLFSVISSMHRAFNRVVSTA